MDRVGAACSARSRLIDYFVEVVAEPCALRASQEVVERFDRRILRCLPATGRTDFPLPDGLPYFCLPECLSAPQPSVYERKPTFFSFSLTGGHGTRAYGFALHYYEPIASASAPASTTAATTAAMPTAWRPHVLCVVSHHPFFSLFKELVGWIYRGRSTHASERRVAEGILADASDQRRWFLSPRATSTDVSALTERLPLLSRAHSDDGAPMAQTHKQTQAQTQAQVRTHPRNNGGRKRDDVLKESSWNDRGNGNGDFEATGAGSDVDVDADEDVDRILEEMVRTARAPAVGHALRLRFHAREFFRYHVQRSNVTHLDDSCFQLLFQCLSPSNVVYLVNCMLLEQRILVHSNHHGLLTPICEALCALLYPFTWEHVYVPFLPVQLIEYLHAPVPYLMGLHTSSLATRVGSEIFSSCVVVHLDKDKVVSPISSRGDESPMDFVLARLPTHEVDMLVRSITPVVPLPISKGTTHSVSANAGRAANGDNAAAAAGNEMELTFGEGSLGITLEPTHLRLLAVHNFEHGRSPGASAVVKALPRLQHGVPGPAERSGLIYPGSFLIGINGESTLDLTFEQTIDRLRSESRPIRLRFLTEPRPHANACQFAERLHALSLVSTHQVDHCNPHADWVDVVRGAFALMFTSIFRDYQRYVCVEHIAASASMASRASQSRTRSSSAGSADDLQDTQQQYNNKDSSDHDPPALRRRRSSTLNVSVTFNRVAFCRSLGAISARSFLREFTQTQSFAGFVNDSVIGRISHTKSYPHLELFEHCIHLHHELGEATMTEAIALLFERDQTAINTIVVDLPSSTVPGIGSAPTLGSTDLITPLPVATADVCRKKPESPEKRSPQCTRNLRDSVVGAKARTSRPILNIGLLETLHHPVIATSAPALAMRRGKDAGDEDHDDGVGTTPSSSLESSGSSRSLRVEELEDACDEPNSNDHFNQKAAESIYDGAPSNEFALNNSDVPRGATEVLRREEPELDDETQPHHVQQLDAWLAAT